MNILFSGRGQKSCAGAATPAKSVLMGPDARILDDIARVAGGAVNILSGMQQQIREEIKARMEDMAARMDLVPREDVDLLQARIDSLEARIATLEKGGAAKKKTAGKRRK